MSADSVDPLDVVRAGYDAVSYSLRADDAQLGDTYASWLDHVERLRPGVSDVLEIGCGCGVPVARELVARGHRVTGVDISPVQIARARALVPEAQFVLADIATLQLAAASVDVVLAFYSLIHVPVAAQPALIGRIASWLRPDGVFAATVGCRAWTGSEEDWLGAPMWWSHADAETYRQWYDEVAFDIAVDDYVPDPLGDGGHQLLIAVRR